MWNELGQVWHEIWMALLLAVVFGVIADVIRIGSHIRTAGRRLKNRLAEFSNAQLRTRIKELEKRKERYGKSDRGIYLYTLRLLMMGLLFTALAVVCAGLMPIASVIGMGMVKVFGPPGVSVPPTETRAIQQMLAMVMGAGFLGTVAVVLHGLRVTSLDTREKIMQEVVRIDAEIESLKIILDGRVRAQTAKAKRTSSSE